MNCSGGCCCCCCCKNGVELLGSLNPGAGIDWLCCNVFGVSPLFGKMVLGVLSPKNDVNENDGLLGFS